jgi:hypothetical protein
LSEKEDIGYAFLPKIHGGKTAPGIIVFAGPGPRRAKLTGRLPNQSLKNAIELRQGLESHPERDFTDPEIRIEQKVAGSFDPGRSDIVDKFYAGDLFECFAQVVSADVDRLRDFAQRKLAFQIIPNELPRFPDFHRLRPMPIPIPQFGGGHRFSYHYAANLNALRSISLCVACVLLFIFCAEEKGSDNDVPGQKHHAIVL